MLSMAASKMSKSLGNVVSVGELLEQGHKGETLRFALLTAHYRQPLEWSAQLIVQSKATLDRLYRTAGDAAAGTPDTAVIAALADDINTPAGAVAPLGDRRSGTLRASGALLGLLGESADTWFRGEGDARRRGAHHPRAEAKQRRDFAAAEPDSRGAGAGGGRARGHDRRHNVAERLSPSYMGRG